MATLEEQVKEVSREDLEKKFMNLYNQLTECKEDNKPTIDIPESMKAENYIDFSKHKIKRRQQYLHKTYTKNSTALNYLLNELIDTRDINLQAYFNKLNEELELLASENEDTPLYDNMNE